MKTNSSLTRSESARQAGAAENFSLRPCARTQVHGCLAVFLMLAVAAAGNLRAPAQTGAPPPPVSPAQVPTNAPEAVAQPPSPAVPAQAVESPTNASAPAVASVSNTNGLRLNFRNAP